ncbi:MAG: hypothetical protein ABIN80_22915 [Dyadobacter sp.]|uniref:hypothetical protein n=1 Tax=Dyadobacter sp. TaxID=1914288 RepID=UPI003263CE4C
MESSISKSIQLSHRQVALAYIIIRVNETRMPNVSRTHETLLNKIERARYVSGRHVVLQFDDYERVIMRQYNTNYCANMADHLLQRDPPAADLEGLLETYLVATTLQTLFSSIQ